MLALQERAGSCKNYDDIWIDLRVPAIRIGIGKPHLWYPPDELPRSGSSGGEHAEGDSDSESTSDAAGSDGDDKDDGGELSNWASEKHFIRQDGKTHEIWFRGLSIADYRTVCTGLEVRTSPLHGVGVFVKEGCVVQAQTWISWYPGYPKRMEKDAYYE